VFLAALLLFPFISASDDYARASVQGFNPVPSGRVEIRAANATSPLAGIQLEETDHSRPVAPFVLLLVLCCFLVILTEQSEAQGVIHWVSPGRAPPAL
jgi:hypothetical protein